MLLQPPTDHISTSDIYQELIFSLPQIQILSVKMAKCVE
jgi:hypothetical protein